MFDSFFYVSLNIAKFHHLYNIGYINNNNYYYIL